MTVSDTWLTSHLDYALGHYSQTVTVNSTDYACAVGEQTRSVSVDEMGMDVTKGIEVMVKTADFTTMLTPGDTLTHNSIEYRVDEVTRSPDGIHTVFGCQELDSVG